MGRLIDVNDLIEEINKKMPQGSARGVFKEFIDEQPTAYSVANVVEELESELEKGNIAIDFGEFRLFEIVKQGGASDDVCEWKQTSTARYKTSCGYKLEEHFDTNACYCKQCGKKIKVVEL